MDSSGGPGLLGILCFGGLFLIFAGIGVWLILRYQKNKEKARQSLNWPKTSGQVIESRVAEHQSLDDDGHTSYSYSPAVRYQYQVNGVAYTGGQVAFGSANVTISSRKKVQQTVDQYPPGKVVEVHYNPQNPAESVLETRTAGKAEFVLGIIFIGFGVSILCLGVSVVVLSWLAQTP